MALDHSEDRMILAEHGASTRIETRAALADNNIPWVNVLAPEFFDAEALGVRVATVTGRAGTFFRGKQLQIKAEHS